MTPEQKAKRYDETLEQLKGLIEGAREDKCTIVEEDIIGIFPELAESKDEKVKRIIHSISNKISFHLHDIFTEEEFQCFDAWSNAWLEKLGKQKPFDYETATIIQKDFAPKEVTCTQEVEVGNGNIKALVTEKLDSTNTNTEDDVRRRSTIRVLEYARGLDTYNQFGKADIDKNIAWLEKQCKPMWTDEDEELLQHCCGAVAAADYYTFEDKEEMTNWLVSLKQRIGG